MQHVTAQDLKSDDIKEQFDQLDIGLKAHLNNENFVATGVPDMLYEEDSEDDHIDCPEPYDLDATAGNIEEDSNTYDEYLWAELYFDIGPNSSPRKGTVKKRLKGEDGQPIGCGHHNPFLDTSWYEVEINGIPHEYAANAIAENLYSHVDLEGRQQLIFREIIKGEDTIPISKGTTTTCGGQSQPVITTKGWELKVKWADRTLSWLPMCEVKNASPVETAEYAVTAKINQEPAFKWWASKTLKKQQAIVAKVKSRYW